MFVLLKCRGSVIPKSLLWSVPCALATVLMHLYWGEESLILPVLVSNGLKQFVVAGSGALMGLPIVSIVVPFWGYLLGSLI